MSPTSYLTAPPRDEWRSYLTSPLVGPTPDSAVAVRLTGGMNEPVSEMDSSSVLLSANLGFLWTELALPDAIRAAAASGFDAVECHAPYHVDPVEIREALDETGLRMVSLNTRAGDLGAGERGLAAVPDRSTDARAAIDEAVTYAAEVGCRHVHVMAGIAEGPTARSTFVDNLTYAGGRAEAVGVGVLIEPINQRDVPGYFLSTVEDAAAIAVEAGPNVRVMFDCYHVQIGQGDLVRRFEQHLPSIGHVQFASVPDRAEPDRGEVAYDWLLPRLYELGYRGFVGAEYRPAMSTEAGLAWLQAYDEAVQSPPPKR